MAAELTEPNVVDGLPQGYVARAAKLDDVEAAVALFNACSRELTGVEEFDAARYAHEWTTPGLNMETDVRVVLAPDARLVGCMELWDISEPHVRIFLFGRVHPEHRGRGIAAHLLLWGEERARRSLGKAPADARVVLINGTYAGDEPGQAAMRAAGFAHVRDSYRMVIEMDTPPPAPRWPAGIRLRTFLRGEDEPLVVMAVREAFRDHWGYVERPLEDDLELWAHFVRTDPVFDASLWFLAVAANPETGADEVAAISLCRPHVDGDPAMGWVGTLGVRRPWRRQGLGLALLHHSFGEFWRRGLRKVGLGVDAQSLTGATRLYERAGMHVARRYVTYEKELRPGRDISTQSVAG